MPHDAPRLSLPAPVTGWPLAVLIAVYLLVGTTGHLPWRGDDLTHLGPIHAILTRGSWLMPEIAGEAFHDFPPLYYWAGAILAKLLGGLLPIHDAARLASSLFTAAFLYWTGIAARRLYGETAFAPAILLALGAVGLVVHAHETQPILAQLAGMAVCYAGLGQLAERPIRGGLQAGLGSGLAFLAGGLPGVVLTVPVLLVAPMLCPSCRNRTVVTGIALGLMTGCAIAGAWLGSAALSDPDALAAWWANELTTNTPHAYHLADFGKLLQLAGWFAWPLWPIAGWAVWRNRHTLATPPLALPLMASLLAILLVATTGNLRPANMLPVLPPLALLAALGVSSLRRGAANAFDWFGIMAFAFFALLVWAGWSALHFGWPPGLARSVAKMAPDFPRDSLVGGTLIGVLISIALLVMPLFVRRTPARGTTNWAFGITLLWCLAVILWQPWFAYTKNYQPVAAELKAALAGQPTSCIARRGLGDTQRAALDYFAGIRTVPNASGGECKLLLTYATSSQAQKVRGEGSLIWERRLGGGRKAETFKLYNRD
ncbi:glycosyltransferase family 39 protein [Zoogloea sp. 1C4]|uniref:ArnT family glycosyltransferase n=1 Tax=Zoogloea sp. 1C4 TaxID=2570190 RepID=UPI0012926FD8|nr:hypothetical protein [Zoogloea sp. 1C4]